MQLSFRTILPNAFTVFRLRRVNTRGHMLAMQVPIMQDDMRDRLRSRPPRPVIWITGLHASFENHSDVSGHKTTVWSRKESALSNSQYVVVKPRKEAMDFLHIWVSDQHWNISCCYIFCVWLWRIVWRHQYAWSCDRPIGFVIVNDEIEIENLKKREMAM